MSLPNREDKEQKPPQAGQEIEESRLDAPARQEEPCEEAQSVPSPPGLIVCPQKSLLCLRASLLWAGAAACLCLAGAIFLLRGCEGRQIIRPTPQMGIESRFWMRVLLRNNVAECTVEIDSPLRIATTDPVSVAPAGGTTIDPLPGPTKISLVDGRLVLGAMPLDGNDVVLSPEWPYIFGLDNQKFRGRLRLIVGREGRSFDAINLVPLEPYLAGVVGKEMPDYWEPQALRAQAIAARTYGLFIKNRFGVNRNYDVSRTQASQVYGGIGAESAPVWDAVNNTCGQVLIAPELMTEKEVIADSTRGDNPQSAIRNSRFGGLFPAYYSSTCGGHTSSSEEVFGDSYGPLKGVECPYCGKVARLELFYWPMATFDRATVTKQLLGRYPKLSALGEITDITAVEDSCFGSFSRLRTIRLTGSTGKTDTLRGEDLRLALDPSGGQIRSAVCRIIPWGRGWAFVSGRGWGHGVGMCQHGAEGMARLGHDAQSIIQYYYPGAEIVNVY